MRKLKFVPNEAPYADFLISCAPTEELDAKMKALGASVRKWENYTAYLWGYPGGDVLMSGTGVIDGDYLVGPRRLSGMPKRCSIGNYFILNLHADFATVCADLMGMGVIYAGRSLVTNRLHLAAIAVGELDINAALTTTYVEHMFCIQFPVSQTPVAGVSIIASDELVEVGGEIRIVRRERFDWKGVATPDEYHQFIQDGAEEIMASVEAILDSGRPVICDISGGRDSRVVFAAIVALGRIKDVRFYTKVGLKARGKLDAAIGSGLVARFGGEYGPSATISGYHVDNVDEKFDRRRSQLFGAYHSIHPNIMRLVSPVYDEPFVRLMGGTGEMYRDYYQRFFHLNDEPYDSELLKEVLSSRCGRIFGDRWLPAYLPLFEETFASLSGRTIGQRLDNHYLNFRNRFHFGLRPTRPGSPLTVSPAASLSLLRATLSLPPSEKSTGRVLFDVTKAMCEELAYYPHDRPSPFDLTNSSYHRPSRFDGMTLDLPPALENLSLQRKKKVLRKPVVDENSFLPMLRKITDLSFDQLRGSAFEAVATRELRDHLSKVYETNWRRMAAWASRLQSFSDYSAILVRGATVTEARTAVYEEIGSSASSGRYSLKLRSS